MKACVMCLTQYFHDTKANADHFDPAEYLITEWLIILQFIYVWLPSFVPAECLKYCEKALVHRMPLKKDQ